MKPEQQFSEVIQLIRRAQSDAYRAINVELINCYWQLGEYISKQISRAVWGDKTVSDLASFIQKQHPDLKGYSRSALYRMRQFYETYCDSQFVAPPARQLQVNDNQVLKFVAPLARQLELTDIRMTLLATINWTNHLIILARTTSKDEREFYVRLCIRENYGKRELERQIRSALYERLRMDSGKLSAFLKDSQKEEMQTLKGNYVFEFLHLPGKHSEKDLQKALIQQMKNFILELGKDFIFMGHEYCIRVGNSDFFIDLLFYHRGLQCLIAFELKTEKFKPEFLGKLNFYLEALDRDVKKEHEKPSIAVLLCPEQDSVVVEYALNRNLSPALVSQYQLQLPDKKLLKEKFSTIFGNTGIVKR